jgi:hypothetical protein
VNDVQDAGSFTVMVWRETTLIGVGVAGDRNGEIFIVVLYTPPGNRVDAFTKNVFPSVTSLVEK